MNIFELLNLRTRFEEIIGDGRSRYEISGYEGTINNLEWFVEHGHKSNRFRKNFDEALDIAKTILKESSDATNECKTKANISGPL